MTKRVLVAVDGTEASNTALEIACSLADKYDAKLGLLCVVEPDRITPELIKGAQVEGVLERPTYQSWYDAALYAPNTLATREQDKRDEHVVRVANAIADEIVAQAEAYTKDSAAKAVKTFVKSGDVAKAILSVAKGHNADVIVMGHDQQGRLESLIKGSVAEQVVREADCPCLVYCLPKKD